MRNAIKKTQKSLNTSEKLIHLIYQYISIDHKTTIILNLKNYRAKYWIMPLVLSGHHLGQQQDQNI